MAKKWLGRSIGLQTLFGLMTALAIILAMLANHLHSERRQSVIERATAAKLEQVSIRAYWRPSDSWLCRLFDPEHTVRLENISIDKWHCMAISTEELITHLKRCKSLKSVSAWGSSPRWRREEDRGGFEFDRKVFENHRQQSCPIFSPST